MPEDLLGSMNLGKSAFLYLVIFGIASAVFKPDILSPGIEDQMILNYMGEDPVPYYRYKTVLVTFTKVLYHAFIVSYIFRENIPLLVGLLLFRAFTSLLFTRLTLWRFDKGLGKPRAFKRLAISLIIILMGYLIVKFFNVGGFILNLAWPILVISAIGLVVLLLNFWNYRNYNRVARYFANEKAIRISISFNAGATSQTELIRSDSWEVNRSRIKNTTESAATYLEKTFAKRFKSFFTDMIRQRVVILSIVFLALLLGALISIVKLVSSIDFTWIEILKSMGTFFSLLVIYDNYQSFIYYLIQPNARNFEIRTPYYRYALKIESLAVIAIFFFEADLLGLLPVLFALAILSFIVLYVFIRRKSLQWFRM